jgi:hypothetical protein
VPDQPVGGQPGGWSVALLQFLDQRNGGGNLAGSPLANELPTIMRCPSVVREAETEPCAYALATNSIVMSGGLAMLHQVRRALAIGQKFISMTSG